MDFWLGFFIGAAFSWFVLRPLILPYYYMWRLDRAARKMARRR